MIEKYETAEAARWFIKDTEFARRKRDQDFPLDECLNCWRERACCVRYSHHVGDCCLHCGNDERYSPAEARIRSLAVRS